MTIDLLVDYYSELDSKKLEFLKSVSLVLNLIRIYSSVSIQHWTNPKLTFKIGMISAVKSILYITCGKHQMVK